MAVHSALTAVEIEPIEADGHGSIGGFEVRCPACGFTFRTVFEFRARDDAAEHVRYMMAKEDREAGDPRFVVAQRELEEVVARNPHLSWGSPS